MIGNTLNHHNSASWGGHGACCGQSMQPVCGGKVVGAETDNQMLHGHCCGQSMQPIKGGGVVKGEINKQHKSHVVEVPSIEEGTKIFEPMTLKCSTQN